MGAPRVVRRDMPPPSRPMFRRAPQTGQPSASSSSQQQQLRNRLNEMSSQELQAALVRQSHEAQRARDEAGRRLAEVGEKNRRLAGSHSRMQNELRTAKVKFDNLERDNKTLLEEVSVRRQTAQDKEAMIASLQRSMDVIVALHSAFLHEREKRLTTSSFGVQVGHATAGGTMPYQDPVVEQSHAAAVVHPPSRPPLRQLDIANLQPPATVLKQDDDEEDEDEEDGQMESTSEELDALARDLVASFDEHFQDLAEEDEDEDEDEDEEDEEEATLGRVLDFSDVAPSPSRSSSRSVSRASTPARARSTSRSPARSPVRSPARSASSSSSVRFELPAPAARPLLLDLPRFPADERRRRQAKRREKLARRRARQARRQARRRAESESSDGQMSASGSRASSASSSIFYVPPYAPVPPTVRTKRRRTRASAMATWASDLFERADRLNSRG